MRKRMFLMLGVVALVVAGLGAAKFQQVQAAIEQFQSFQPPPEAVTTVIARHDTWDATLTAIGTVTAVHGVTVSADLPGIVERIAFDSGRMVRRGDLLIALDTRQEKAQLAAAEARRELARLQLERMVGLRAKGVVSQAELDQAEADAAQAEAHVGEILATIERKHLRAPFAGVLGIRQVDLGQYLSAGDPVVPLQSLQPIHVDFSVPQQQVSRLATGTRVEVSEEGAGGPGAPTGGTLSGEVTAIDSVVDEETRNVRVQATLANPAGRLRPGMFVEAQVHLGDAQQVVPLPASAIHYAPYGDSVYVVEQSAGPDGEPRLAARQQFVALGPARGDQVAVLAGVEPGEEVVTSGVFKLRNGVAVLVDNEVQPGNDPSPAPANS